MPQADEQQRLLANLVTQMNLDRTPLPRFWYLPARREGRGRHDRRRPRRRRHPAYFNRFKPASPAGCSVADWECVRSPRTSTPNTAMTDAQARPSRPQGFEIALHLNTGCADFTPARSTRRLATQLAEFARNWPSRRAPRRTARTASPGATGPASRRSSSAHGIRLDTNYYYWPGGWVQNRPGMFTGSGFPMRFADLDGSLIDVYQATTQITDESEIDMPTRTSTRCWTTRSGPKATTASSRRTCTPTTATTRTPTTIVAAAQARGVPVVSAEQMLDWLDGRNGSSFGDRVLRGRPARLLDRGGRSARGLEAMLPAARPSGPLSRLSAERPAGHPQHAHRQGRGLRRVQGGGRRLRGHVRADSSPPAISGLSRPADEEGHAQVRWEHGRAGHLRVRYGRTTRSAARSSTPRA